MLLAESWSSILLSIGLPKAKHQSFLLNYHLFLYWYWFYQNIKNGCTKLVCHIGQNIWDFWNKAIKFRNRKNVGLCNLTLQHSCHFWHLPYLHIQLMYNKYHSWRHPWTHIPNLKIKKYRPPVEFHSFFEISISAFISNWDKNSVIN